MKPSNQIAIFFDNREGDFHRFSADYPHAFQAWVCEDAVAYITSFSNGEKIFLSVGNVPIESDLLVTWLMVNKEWIKPRLELIVHTRNCSRGETLFHRLKTAGFDPTRKFFGRDWMLGQKACERC